MGHVLRISIIRIYYIKVSSRLEMSFDRNRPFYKISFPSPFAFFWPPIYRLMDSFTVDSSSLYTNGAKMMGKELAVTSKSCALFSLIRHIITTARMYLNRLLVYYFILEWKLLMLFACSSRGSAFYTIYSAKRHGMMNRAFCVYISHFRCHSGSFLCCPLIIIGFVLII